MAWPRVCIWLRQDVDTSFSIGSVATYHSPSHYVCMYCQSKAVMLRRCILNGKINSLQYMLESVVTHIL